MDDAPDSLRGFTLIEMAIVLVIIGLIVGGVLVGQDLIRAAEVRATISQIEKYQTAVNTFYGKYGALPGDLNQQVATMFGFAPRGTLEGQGDGNGLIEGVANSDGAFPGGGFLGFGETTMFWADLSKAGLIDGTFTAASGDVWPGTISGTALDSYYPQAKLGRGNYIYAWSGGWVWFWSLNGGDGLNYFGISALQLLDGGIVEGNTTISVAQAYAIDTKVDDGLPQAGRVTAMYSDESCGGWAAAGGDNGDCGDSDPNGGPVVAGDGVATAPSATTCYDNANVAGATEKYSIGQNSGSGPNCALSFRFQ
ncbi:MAG: type II secretion system protein [Terriglobales bacterium]